MLRSALSTSLFMPSSGRSAYFTIVPRRFTRSRRP
nr:MAG TPA_asm: hypothetical protein [Caudoviricetes sp.]